MGSVQQSAPALPIPDAVEVGSGITLLKPLSRRGVGPGLIILRGSAPSSPSSPNLIATIHDGHPSPAMKWAEESYCVVEIGPQAWKTDNDPIASATKALMECDVCDPKGKVGLIVFDPEFGNLASLQKSHEHGEIVGAVIYQDGNTVTHQNPGLASFPVLQHLAGKAAPEMPRTDQFTPYNYPSSSSFQFADPSHSAFHPANEALSHTRNLTFLKKLMNGPTFDLEAIWDEHTYFEFEVRSTDQTMATMVQEPYVNHIPTVTGGIGRHPLSDFYQNHFIFQNPADTELELISRTVGIDRVVDEFIYKFTHDRVIDWLLPGIPPTGKRAEIPFTAVVNVRGDRLYHEHIAWDQATALRQLGLLPEYLPYPYALADGSRSGPSPGKRLEYRVPAAGIETANKMRDKNSVESNGMFEFQIREVDI